MCAHKHPEPTDPRVGPAIVYLIVGLPCAGKTSHAKELEISASALRLTPDEWQIALFGDQNPPDKRDLVEGKLVQLGMRAAELGINKDRVWAVEGCNGIGRHLAQRLVADGESVVDVPAKLSARARVFSTGQGRKTDPVDAHSVAVAALRTKGLRQVSADDTTVALRLLVDRRDVLGRARTETVSRLHHLLLELIPGGAKKYLSAPRSGPATSSDAADASWPAS